ncbi:MAG: hypothetical protein HWE34_16865 [Methylocystaceae bacterium]|nr:hypothetical protein [Methylocystaceae bacterium]
MNNYPLTVSENLTPPAPLFGRSTLSSLFGDITSPSLFDGTSMPLLLQPVGDQSYQDCIRLQDILQTKADNPSIDVLKHIIHGGCFSNNVVLNDCISYAVNTHYMIVQESTTFLDGGCAGHQPRHRLILQGSWFNKSNGHSGNGIISLIREMRGCDTVSAYYVLADYYQIPIRRPNIPQAECSTTDVFIDNPSAYNALPLPNHPILGKPKEIYEFQNLYGVTSFVCCSWFFDGALVQLYCIYVRDALSGYPQWKFVRPPAGEMLFNKHRLSAEKDMPVHIFDCFEDAETHRNDRHFIATWAGMIEHVEFTDWRLLAGRDVTYTYDGSIYESTRLAPELRTKLSHLGVKLELWSAS